ncbi:MAG: hypothetical protein H6811_03600 [Phycisphaeraceae bacterium]|nr:hypothetical protein [Phycisphaeraceae bacterium]
MFKPGQRITCTIESAPGTTDAAQTVQRLMRRDPATAKALRKGQKLRRTTTTVKNRGNRDWYNRPVCGKVCHPVAGSSWTMTYTPDLEKDLESVKSLLKIQPA